MLNYIFIRFQTVSRPKDVDEVCWIQVFVVQEYRTIWYIFFTHEEQNRLIRSRSYIVEWGVSVIWKEILNSGFAACKETNCRCVFHLI